MKSVFFFPLTESKSDLVDWFGSENWVCQLGYVVDPPEVERAESAVTRFE